VQPAARAMRDHVDARACSGCAWRPPVVAGTAAAGGWPLFVGGGEWGLFGDGGEGDQVAAAEGGGLGFERIVGGVGEAGHVQDLVLGQKRIEVWA